ncbi:MAG: DUF3396 domain-containing protein [Acinetobacter sp.]|nr:DUF3396 domain-containing protein [Acinetobacter sp.]
MKITSYSDLDPYFSDFQWSEARKDQSALFITGAEFQAHFLYFAGHTSQKRQALAECVELFNRHFAEHLEWGGYYDENGDGHYAEYKDPQMPTIRQVIAQNKDPDDFIEWYCASGDRDEAPEYMISAMTNRDWEGHNLYCSEIKFCVPNKLIFEPEMKKVLLDMIDTFIEKLGVYHAVAGIQSVLPYRPQGVGDYARLQAERFLGIYMGADSTERNLIRNGIKSIDWFTYISNTLAQRICSLTMFPKYCELLKVKVQQKPHGFQFLLEEFPQILPQAEPIPDSYFNLNKALRPLRNGAYWAISKDVGKNYKVLDTDATRKWIRRLDAPGIFPDQGYYKEVPPKDKAVYLETGKACKVAGVYRYDDELDIDGKPVHAGHVKRTDYEENYTSDYRQHVVLLVGDIAPRFLAFFDHAELKEAKTVKWHLVSEIIKVE